MTVALVLFFFIFFPEVTISHKDSGETFKVQGVLLKTVDTLYSLLE